ncbi:MAG: transporter substrate-binding domain-containing protein [Gammaproteobacteria bacterium]|nr:transporter substrate-binding domain-containing protein [Gammaproteobacteria bacterium]
MALNKPIIWGTDVWDGFTNTDGTGFYHALIPKIFPSPDYSIEINYLPWKRSLLYLESGKVHMSGALPATNTFYLSEAPVLTETLFAVYVDKSEQECCDFTNKIGSYRNGYENEIFNRAFPDNDNAVSVSSGSEGIKLLLRGKVDYFVDIGSVLERLILDFPADLKLQAVGSYPLYWAFNKTLHGQDLKRHFDKKIKELRQSGQLEDLYLSYGLTPPKIDVLNYHK